MRWELLRLFTRGHCQGVGRSHDVCMVWWDTCGAAGRGKLGYIGTWGGRVFWNWYPICGPLYWFGGGPVRGNVAIAAALYGPNWVPSAAGCLGTSFPLPENRYLWSIPISRRMAMVFFWATLSIWGNFGVFVFKLYFNNAQLIITMWCAHCIDDFSLRQL